MSYEEWIPYNNLEQKRSWGKWNEPTTAKAILHPKKVMCIHRKKDWKGVFYYELLLENQMINSNKTCSQTNWKHKKCLELVNRQCIVFHQGNRRLHVSLMTCQKLLQLGWEVLIPPSSSPNIAPLDFHLFYFIYLFFIYFSLYKILLMEKSFNSLEDCKRHWEHFFAQDYKCL